ncbi:MAG TPA: metal ABC transporter substrate-binding protein [Rickettsiales bacterium]|nr:metal ABC transporter substrate-binding protein [Rickettsiales bacterium]
MKALLISMLVLLLPMQASAQHKLKVVASFSVLGDIVHQVAQNDADVQVLVGPNGNAHEYEPTTADARMIADADIVFVNGLGFEGWMQRLIASAGYKGRVVTVSAGVKPITTLGHEDPHAWQDVANVKLYAANIRDALAQTDMEHAADYTRNADAYIAQLEALDTWVKAQIASVPPQKRKVISAHDAFGYFAAHYGVVFIAPLGMSAESQPSAADIARIIDAVRKQDIRAVFLENMADTRLMEQIKQDSGAHLGGTLYSDALSPPHGPAADYLAMQRHNVAELVAAMQENPGK